MKLAAALAMGLPTLGLILGAADSSEMRGVPQPQRASQNWMLQCQGCHRPTAGGTDNTTPPLANQVARFLHAPGGREYLVRVPGVATSALSHDQLAELLNWTLYRFDPHHVPDNFHPYTAQEIAQLRNQPFRTEARVERDIIIRHLSD